jgi:hypothetical protein
VWLVCKSPSDTHVSHTRLERDTIATRSGGSYRTCSRSPW